MIRDEGALVGIGTEPKFAIGQRALLVPHSDGNVLWDCVTLLDDETEREIDSRGGLHAIAISHPHYYSAMVEWAHRFDCPVLLHEADREWVMRDDPKLEFWSGETYDLGDGLTLIRCGGHFAGGTVLHRGRRPARGRHRPGHPGPRLGLVHVQLPELHPAAGVRDPVDRGGAGAVRRSRRIYGAWWGTVIPADGKGIVQRSAQRYVDALNGKLP